MRSSTDSMLKAMQRIVAAIPPGRVMSYGAVARAAGFPRHVRMVAKALAASPEPLPWFRVLNAQGGIPVRGLTGEDEWQRVQLEAEGVTFDPRGRVNMRELAWYPDEIPRP
ncbi:MGMT family protein [Paludibacterium purpuratum]|uniref:O(6)-alkylguanine repair protein YbaZ n=1 Tax=Paludibacterium purpuratum TaxID=1144873 RepID=A0A4R7B195_9NEIS|nr:MGMT family protein [Paludibacterium purpuratum]TDR73251.1 O(6)-alkylguanine repair protein YbaZ [Paludibacterium purpuratum]